MGKGKRNRQFHYEDKQANPEKYQEKKKPFRMPKWATYTICVVLLLAIIIPIVITGLINGGTFLRGRILVESSTGKYDMNQQMATFILWQNMYQSAYYEYYYMAWGLQEDTEGIVEEYQNNGGAAGYGIDVASTYTSSLLREGISDISDYLIELVAGADAGVNAGLTLNKADKEDIKEYSTWMENVFAASAYASYTTYDNFLSTMVGEGFNRGDIEDAAELITMYTKYCNSTKLDLDTQPSTDVLQEYIEKNPSGHYEIKYHTYKNAGETFMKKLYEKLGKTWDPDAKEDDKEKAVEEAVLNLDVKEFRALVIESILEDDLKPLMIEKYLIEKVVKTDYDIISDKDLTEEVINNKLGELGIEKTSYKSDNEELPDNLSTYLFNSKRKAGEVAYITDGDSVYLVYIFTAPTADTENKKLSVVEAGWKEYKYADYETDEMKSFFGRDGLLFADLDKGEKTDATKDLYKSADELAKALYDKIKEDAGEWNTIDASDLTTETVKKPADDDDDTTAIQDTLYATGVTVKVGNYYQVDDNGTSHVVKVTAVNGTDYTISYTTHKDSDYYSIYRTLSSTFTSSYSKDPATLSHPETTEKGTFQEWLCEGEYKDGDRTFDRVANDIKHFAINDSNDNATGEYNVYIVETAMTQTKDDTATVYGGYLLYNTQEEAEAALESIKGLAGFQLWTAFGNLSVTKITTDSDGEQSESVTAATLETDLTASDLSAKELQDWLFNAERKQNDVGVVKSSSGYYLAYFFSTEETWSRTAKDGWVTSQMTEKLTELIENGGYELNQTELEKIPATELDISSTDTTAATE